MAMELFFGTPGVSGDDSSHLRTPQFLTSDAANIVYVAEGSYPTQVIRKISPAGVISPFYSGGGEPIGHIAATPSGVVYYVNPDGKLYRADTAGNIEHVAGDGTRAIAPGHGTAAKIGGPNGLAVLPDGTCYLYSWVSGSPGAVRILKVTPSADVTIFAGSGSPGTADGTGTAAQFYGGGPMTTDAAGNIYALDGNVPAIRKITPAGVVTTLVVLYGELIGGAGTTRQILPHDICCGSDGHLYLTVEYYIPGSGPFDRRVLKVDTTTAAVTTVHTVSQSQAQLHAITDDTTGNLYVSVLGGTDGYTIQKIGAAFTPPPDPAGDDGGPGGGGGVPGDIGNPGLPEPGTIFDPGAIAPARPVPECATLLDLIREFSAAVRRPVRITGPTSIEMVDPAVPLPAGWTISDASDLYCATTYETIAGLPALSIEAGDLELNVSGTLVADDVRLITSTWRIPDRLPVYGSTYIAPVKAISFTFTPDHFTGAVDFQFFTIPLTVRRT